MSSPDGHRMASRGAAAAGMRGRPGQVPLTIGVFLALVAAMLPLLQVIQPGGWIGGSLLMLVGVFGVGFAARWYRLPAVAVSLSEAVVWIVLMTVLFFAGTAILGILPSVATFQAVPTTITDAIDEIQLGAAPLPASAHLSALLVGSAGLLAIIMDHVVLTARLPLVAGIGLVAVSLIPSIAVPNAFEVLTFALLAAAVLFLIRTETRTRTAAKADAGIHRARPSTVRTSSQMRAGGGTSGVWSTALAIGAVALVVSVIATPALPPPAQSAFPGSGSVTINASLALGNDLRRQADVQVLTYTTTADNPPYLRAATLSSFNGNVWQPDQHDMVPITDEAAFGDVQVGDDVTLDKATTDITVQNLSTRYLPLPYPAVRVEGLSSQWSIVPNNRTIEGVDTATASGLSYQVTTDTPDPTLEQIEAASAHVDDGDPADTSLPSILPAVIANTALRITAGTKDDYDALIALQNWFRGPEFTYSLTSPAKGGYDDDGVDAVAQFLKVKSGYCIHFASAFAIMARTLGMTARIVVGFLPGTPVNGANDSGAQQYSVSSTELHAWPEVYFGGIGWVPFDPTKGLGDATSFSPAESRVAGGGSTGPTPSATPSTTKGATQAPGKNPDQADGSDGGSTVTQMDPVPLAVGVALVLVLLSLPSIFAAVRRRRLDAAARDGDAPAAWLSVQQTAIDVGMSVPTSESVRAFGQRMVDERGLPAEEVGRLVHAVEESLYAPPGERVGDERMADISAAVRVALLHSVDSRGRFFALVFPRSLVIRPGSVFAGARAGTRSEAGVRAR